MKFIWWLLGVAAVLILLALFAARGLCLLASVGNDKETAKESDF
ncbi:MAG TPA: hypothetical protein V6C81_29375 [Planktothrix sp.]|jgi:hypothetical protein